MNMMQFVKLHLGDVSCVSVCERLNDTCTTHKPYRCTFSASRLNSRDTCVYVYLDLFSGIKNLYSAFSFQYLDLCIYVLVKCTVRKWSW